MLSLFTAPATEPLTLDEAKLHLRVDADDEDSLIESLIAASREYAESFTRRQFITATYDWKLDGLYGDLRVPMAPLVSVTSVTYLDSNGSSATLAASQYIVDAPAGPMAMPGRIVSAYGVTYPSTYDQANAVTIRFVAGYGDAGDVPESIKAALKLMLGHLYANRESVVITGRGSIVAEMPETTKALLWPYRVSLF